MPLTTAGHTWIDGETVTYAKLRAAATPVVTITDADVTAIAEDLSASAAGINYFVNSDLRTWTAATVSLPASWTLTAAGWYAKGTYSPSVSTGMTVQRSGDAVHDHVIYCASITGESNGTIASIGQRLSSFVAAAMLEDGATIQIEVENKTGSSQTATLVWDTCDAQDDFSATTQQTTVSLGTVLANERKTLSATLDLTSFKTATRRGGILSVQLPGLNSGSKEWRVYYSRLEPGQFASPRRIERDGVEADSTTTSDLINYFDNPLFARWLGSGSGSSMTATEAVDSYFAERWGILSSAGTPNLARGVNGVGLVTSPDSRSTYVLQITGDAPVVGVVDLFQDLYRYAAGHVLADTMNISWWVWNGTGASFTPQLRIDTPNAGIPANGTPRTNQLAQSMQACGNNAWTRVTLSITPSSYTRFANGARISLRIPAGSLDSTAKSVRVTQAQFVRGSAPVTFTAPLPEHGGPAASTARTAEGLVIKMPTTTTIQVTCTAAICAAPDGSTVRVTNVDSTIDIALGGYTNGQWYLVRLTADEAGRPTAQAYLETTGAANPAVATGNVWRSGVIGAFYYTGGAVVEFSQRGNYVVTLQNAIAFTTSASANTYQQVAVASGLEFSCPAIAIGLRGSFGPSATAIASRTALAASASGLGAVYFVAGSNSTTAMEGFIGGAAPFHMPLGASRELWIKTGIASIACRVATTGFDLP
jgi:hypothetical protein